MTMTEPSAEPQASEPQTAQASEPVKRTNMPTYGVGAGVAELPTEPERAKGRVYFDLMDAVKADEANLGLWVPIATFQTPTGARDVQKALAGYRNSKTQEIVAPVRDVPKGEWEIKAVKLAHPDNPTKRISKLYVRYLGEG